MTFSISFQASDRGDAKQTLDGEMFCETLSGGNVTDSSGAADDRRDFR